MLEALESKAGRALNEVFDVIAGTSVGGLIAAGLALQIPAGEIRGAIESHGPTIFDQRLGVGNFRLEVTNPLKSLYKAKYPQQPLKAAVEAIFGVAADESLARINTPLLLVTVNAGTGLPLILKSRGLAGDTACGMALKDALLATTAAPTFFPPHFAKGETFVDGGLIANAPDLVAVTETSRNFGCEARDLRVLSVGTASTPHEVTSIDRAPGLLSWLFARGLVQLTLTAQEELAVDQCSVLLRDRYLRLDHKPVVSDRRKIGLDNAGPQASDALRRAAAATVETFKSEHRAAIRRFLSHESLGPRRAPIS